MIILQGSAPSTRTVFLMCLVIKGSVRPTLSPAVCKRGQQPPGACFLLPSSSLCLGLQTHFNQFSLRSSPGP